MSERLLRYKKAKQDRLEGKYNGAPLFFTFPRLAEYIPVIPRGKQLMILGGSGTGKSQSWVGLVLMPIYNLIKNKNYKAHFHIFLLEDPLELLEDRLFCRVLYLKSGKKIQVDPLELNSMKKEIIGSDAEALFDEVDKIVEDILSYCTVYTNQYYATGIYKTLRTVSGELGEHVWETRDFTYKKSDGSTYTEPTKVYKEYKPNDPEIHNIVIADNLNNFSEENDKEAGRKLTVRECMNRWCRDYSRLQITKHWNWTVVNIVQSAMEADRQQFDLLRGKQIIEKVEPNMSSLGESKIIARDCHLILALFSPSRFGISEYEGYDIDKLGDKFRALLVLKSNFGLSNIKFPLYFNGAVTYYEELSKSSEIDYKKYIN